MRGSGALGIGSELQTRRFRVAMVAASPFPFPQGSQVLIAQLSDALRRRGHRVSIVTYHVGQGELSDEDGVHRIPTLPIGSRASAKPSIFKPLLDLLLARELLKIVRNESIDVIHAHNIEGLMVGFLARRYAGIPVVYHVHNLMTPELHTYFESGMGQWAGRLLGRWADCSLLRRADGCIALNARAISSLMDLGVRAENLWQIPPAISFDANGLEDTSAEVLRARYNLGDRPVVLYAGNLDRYQDIALLVRVFRRVVAVHPAVRLLLVSHGQSNPYQGLIARMGLERWVHFITLESFEALHAPLRMADVVVSPRTVCFGFPIKLLNYMAAGKAIVASAGSAQGIRHMENGWIVPNGDEGAFARAILTLLDDRELAMRLGDEARQLVDRFYAWDRVIGDVESVYDQLTK